MDGSHTMVYSIDYFDFLDYFFKMYKIVFDLPNYDPISDIMNWHFLKDLVCGNFHISQTDFHNCLLPLHELKRYLETKEVISSCLEEILLPNLMVFINDPMINEVLRYPKPFNVSSFSFHIDRPPLDLYDKSYIGEKIIAVQSCKHNSLMRTILFENGESLDLFGNCRVLPLVEMKPDCYTPFRVNIVYDDNGIVTHMWEG